jgi:anaerobic dimethyl sulfoxide reductase subunit A
MEGRGEERVVTTSCDYDCGGRCLLKVYLDQNGEVKRISTDGRPEPSLKACFRGLLQKDVLYSPDRLKKPMKRTGERGKGGFQPIEWNEALDIVARELKRVKDRYGNDAIFLMDYSGSLSNFHGGVQARRFFSLLGGCSTHWGNSSFEGATLSSISTFGTIFTGTTRDNLLYSRLIILWGWNPLDTRFGPDTSYYLIMAKKKGAEIVSVDPRYNHSARVLSAKWIPIRPATDTAMLIAMAYVMIKENIYDRSFVENYTYGFDKFRDYVLGEEDGIPKTPLWAEGITGVPAREIEGLARKYALSKPAALCTGWAPGRTAFGEQYHRAASAIAAITGNIGIKGGYAAGGTGLIPFGSLGKRLPLPKRSNPGVHIVNLFDLLIKGKSGGYPMDIKLLYIVGSNPLNQFPNINKGSLAFKRPEFIVVHDIFMTPTAKYADILLPVTTFMERIDIAQPWMGGTYFIYMNKVIEPLYEAKTDFQIFSELASRMGIMGFSEKKEEEWLREFAESTPGLPPYEVFKYKGIHEFRPKEPWIAFKEEIEDPVNHPFPTPSGKIEIYSHRLAKMNNPILPSIPTYIDPWEGPNDPIRERYPLQLISPHSRARVNSQFWNIPRIMAHADDRLHINPEDAKKRGIGDGEKIRVFNDRGVIITTARVTDMIMKGVVSLDSGAWFDPDERGIDRGGSVNCLTLDRTSPGGAFACNSCLVQIEKASG